MKAAHPRAGVRHGESVERAAAAIRAGILEGRFALGQRLIARELMDELGYGRGTLREAFNQLAADGLVELIPNRGATVRRLTRRQITEVYPVRELLEGLSARLAAAAVAADRRLRTRVLALRQQVRVDATAAQFHAQNVAIHGLLLELGGNACLADTMAKLHVGFVMAQARLSIGPAQIARSQREHRAILQAVADGAADAADAAMRRHLRNTGAWMATLPEAVFKPAAPPPLPAPPAAARPRSAAHRRGAPKRASLVPKRAPRAGR